MQQKFKKLIYSLLVLPCLILLTACNGNQLDTNANVNTTGNYKISTYEDLKENALDKIGDNYLDASYKITARLNLGGTPMVNLNGIVKGNNLDNLQAAFKLISIGARAEYYVSNGVMYFLDSNNKIKSSIPSVEALKKQLGVTDILTLSEVFNKIEDARINENLKVEKHSAGTENKFKVTFALKANNVIYNYRIYFVFNENNLTGVKVEYNSDVYTLELNMEQFNGNITYPDFSDYADANIFNVENSN